MIVCVCVCNMVQMGLMLVLSVKPPMAALILIKGKRDMEAFSQRDWGNQPHTFTWTNTFELDPQNAPLWICWDSTRLSTSFFFWQRK